MEGYNENQLNSEESELSLEDAMKVNGTTNIPDVNLEDIEDATLDTETIGTFKIDDSMPEELKLVEDDGISDSDVDNLF